MEVFHYKPSILGYPYFWKHPYVLLVFFGSECGCGFQAWIPGAQKLEKKIHRDTKLALRGWLPERPEHLRIRRYPAVAAADEVLGEMHCDVTGPQFR